MFGNDLPWRETWRENMDQMSRVSDVGYWNKRAEDYDDFIRTSQFDYGRKITKILCGEGLIRPDDAVLEIAGGVGALTLPLAARAGRVTTIEPAVEMAERLEKNMMKHGVSNIDIKISTQQDFEAEAVAKSVDMAILCHAAWQFPDIEKLLCFMDRISRGYCCLADTVFNTDSVHQAFYEKLGIGESAFDRVFHLYNILCERGSCPGISFFEYRMRRSVESAQNMWTHLVGKYRNVTPKDLEWIREHVSAHADNGIYEDPCFMGVMWWKSREVQI